MNNTINQSKLGVESPHYKNKSHNNSMLQNLTSEGNQHDLCKPILKITCGLSISFHEISSVFTAIASAEGFRVVHSTNNFMFAIKSSLCHIPLRLLKLLPWFKKSTDTFTSVSIRIMTNTASCTRIIKLKGCSGSKQSLIKFISKFREKFMSINKQQFRQEHDTRLDAEHNGLLYNELIIEDDDDNQNLSSLNRESYAFYYFTKMLCCEGYGLSKIFASFLKDFEAKYQSIYYDADSNPLESVLAMIQEIEDIFFRDFNFGKADTRKMMPFCRNSVEKYTFNKIGLIIHSYYKDKSRPLLPTYQTNRNKFKLMKIEEICDFFKMNECLFLFKGEEIVDKFFSYCLNDLNLIKNTFNPFEMLSHMMSAQNRLQIVLKKFFKWDEMSVTQKEEKLKGIDILALLMCSLDEAPIYLLLLKDYISLDKTKHESERLVVTEFKEAMDQLIEYSNKQKREERLQ